MSLNHSELLCNKVLLKYKREKVSDIDIRKGQKECPLTSVSKGVIYSPISYYNESKECLEVVKILLDSLPQYTFQDKRISQKALRKEKLSSSRIHRCYIILSTEFKIKELAWWSNG